MSSPVQGTKVIPIFDSKSIIWNFYSDVKASLIRRDSAGSDRLGELHMGTPGEKFDAMEFQKELGKIKTN